jgi:hemolysin activation/secretion protein
MAFYSYRWAGVIAAVLLCAGNAAAQLERVAPKKPERKPAAGAQDRATDKAKAPRAADVSSEGPRLAGLRIVGSKDETRAKGEVQARGLEIGPGRDLDLLRGEDFRALADVYLGQPISDASINRLQRDIVRFYRDKGRPLLEVVVPEQESVAQGVLQVFVLEAALGRIEVEGNKWSKLGLFTSNLRLKEGEPIDSNRLIEDVDWLNQNPGRHVNVAFKPGERVGQSDVVLRVEERRPVRVYLGYENNGPQFASRDRVSAGINWFNAFGLDHRLNYQHTRDVDFEFIEAHSASYEVPLPWRHTLTLYGGYIDSKADFPTPLINQEGTSYQVSLRYEVPLPAFRKLKHSISGGFDFKSFDNNLELGGAGIFATAVDVAQFAIIYKAAVPDRWGSTGFRAETYLSPGSLTGNNNDIDFATQRRAASAAYSYARFHLQRDTRLPGNWMWVLRGMTQAADGNLQGSEQFALGGGTTVRGYDEREANGDRGWFVSNEIWTPSLPVLRFFDEGYPDGLHLLGFVDYGETQRIDTITGEDPNLGLASVGVGLRYNFNRSLALRFDYGWQLRDTGPANPHTGNNSSGHLSVLLSF